MKKPSKTKPSTKAQPEAAPQGFRLDEKIQDFLADSARLIKRIWLPSTVILGAVLIGFLLWGLVILVKESKETGLAERLQALTGAEDPAAAEFAGQSAELDALVRDARGADAERMVLKGVVSYLQEMVSPSSLKDPFSFSKSSASATETDTSAKDTPAVLNKVEEYAQAGRERFPGDEDMQKWAASAIAWVKSEREFAGKKLEKRAFSPVIPDSARTPAPEAPPAVPAPGAAEAGPAGEGAPQGSTGAAEAPPVAPPATEAPASGTPASGGDTPSVNGAGTDE